MVTTPRFRARPATSGLIALCTVVFVVTWVAALLRADDPFRVLLHSLWVVEDADLLERAGAVSAVRIWLDGEWWRVVTAGFLHGSWLHLGLNMVGLWAVGQWTEGAWGWWRQLLLFLVASVGGCLASLAWAEAPLVVGASAGIFGIAGALVVARAWGRAEVQMAVGPVSAKVLAFWVAFLVAGGALFALVFGITLLAQGGHVGGLAFGVAAGFALSVRMERRRARVLSWSGVVLGLLGVVGMAAKPAWRVNYHAFVGAAQLERGNYEAAATHFDAALSRSPNDAELANAVAYALAEAGVELERAKELVAGALEGDPNNAHYLDTLGWVQCKQGLITEGVETLVAAKAAAEVEIPDIDQHIEGCATVGDAGF